MPTVRNILAVVSDAASGRATLETAFRTARHLNCHVDALHVRSDPAAALPLVGEALPPQPRVELVYGTCTAALDGGEHLDVATIRRVVLHFDKPLDVAAAVLRLDQAQAAVDAGELRIWPHWQDETWLCWLQKEGPEDHALAVLRELVEDVWRD